MPVLPLTLASRVVRVASDISRNSHRAAGSPHVNPFEAIFANCPNFRYRSLARTFCIRALSANNTAQTKVYRIRQSLHFGCYC